MSGVILTKECQVILCKGPEQWATKKEEGRKAPKEHEGMKEEIHSGARKNLIRASNRPKERGGEDLALQKAYGRSTKREKANRGPGLVGEKTGHKSTL